MTERARRGVDPVAEERRHVRLAGVAERPVFVHPGAQQRAGTAPLVEDEATDHDVGARRHQALQPVRAARARHVLAVAPLRDHALELVLRDDVEERLAVALEVLGHDEALLGQSAAEEAPAPLLEPDPEERLALVVEQIERDEEWPPAALRGLRTESSDEQVIARPATRVADDDLAVEQRAFGEAQRAELGYGGAQGAPRPVDDP